MSIHNKIILKMLEENLSIKDASRKFNVNTSLIYRSINKIKVENSFLYSTLMLNLKKLEREKYQYMQAAKYIIDNNVSMKEAAKKFNTTIAVLHSNFFTYLKPNYPELYNKLKTVLKQVNTENQIYYKFAEYVIANNKSKKEVMEELKINNKQISKRLEILKKNDLIKYEKVNSILKNTSKHKQTAI